MSAQYNDNLRTDNACKIRSTDLVETKYVSNSKSAARLFQASPKGKKTFDDSSGLSIKKVEIDHVAGIS
jgi:hypothetical protein